MSRTLSLTSALIFVTHAAFAAGLGDSLEYLRAQQALSDGMPEVAGVKAERLLARKGWTRAETKLLATFAAEAWTRAQDGMRVLALCEAYDLNEESFWRAQALTLNGELAQAREELTSDSAVHTPRVRLLLGQILMALGENDAAHDEVEPLLTDPIDDTKHHARLLLAEIDISAGRIHAALKNLDPINDAGDPKAAYLRARCHLSSNELPQARAQLQRVLDATSGGERPRHAATILLAEVLMLEKKIVPAWEYLMKLLDTTQESALWTEAFNMLDKAWQEQPQPHTLPEAVLVWVTQGNRAQQSPEPNPALLRMIADFRGHALFTCARWLQSGKRELEAVSLLECLLQTHPDHPRTSEAMRMAMEIYVRMHADERALTLAEAWRAKFSGKEGGALVDFLAGDILHRRGEFMQSQESFQAAANVATTLSERRRALFNAAVAAVKSSDLVLYLGLLAQLEVTGGSQDGTGDSAADLELDKALRAAALGQDDAEESLRTFLTARPYHSRRAEAQIAIAEWLLLTKPQRTADAKAMLDSITLPNDKSEATEKLQQRIDYTRIWLRESAGDLKALITEAPVFLKQWPKSPLLVDVLMKAASAHLQLEDFANARTNFEIIAKEYPDTPQADSALYFAALSAMSVMSTEGRERAMQIWDELAKKNGSLAVPSRRQQALAHRRQGDLPAALKAQDQILALPKLDKDLRRLTLCEKAEVLLLHGKKVPASLDEAAKLLRGFLNDESPLPFLWQARAGFTLATALHDAKHQAEALEACYDVLRAADATPPANPADYLWFSKAGFFGIELLEAAHQWEAAARLAEQIANLPGDRALDAKQLATKIRLAHFLWDGPKPTPPEGPVEEKKAQPVPPEPAKKSGKKK